MREFSIIAKYFKPKTTEDSVLIGSGDDAAVVSLSPHHKLLVSTDTMLVNRHFLADFPVSAIINRAFAANLSDIAAMGASAKWLVVALTMPNVDEEFLQVASETLHLACDREGVSLIGGDLTKGPLSITMTIMGEAQEAHILRRDGARVGDSLYVSADLGEVKYALEQLAQKDYSDRVFQKLFNPGAQTKLAPLLAGIASSCIDISDGLLQDLGHLLAPNALGANIYMHEIPVSEHLLIALGQERAQEYALSSGEEFELLFTIDKQKEALLADIVAKTQVKLTKIGDITHGGELNIFDKQGNKFVCEELGYQHF